MKKFFRRKRHHFIAYLAMLCCGAITTYVFAASYETVFNKSLPFVHAVSAISIAPVEHIVSQYRTVSQTDIGNYGKPLFLKLPAQDVRMTLAPGIEDNGTFLARASAGHYFLISTPKSGDLGNIVVYFEKSWRTDNQPEKMKPGDNIFIDTDRDWRYFYRIDTVNKVPANQTFVARSGSVSQLVLVATGQPGTREVIIAQAALVNVQNVRQ